MRIGTVSRLTTFLPVERRSQLSERDFVQSCLRVNRPVLVTDGLRDWKAVGEWTPQYFRKHFGTVKVDLQNRFFHTVSSITLEAFIDALWHWEAKADEEAFGADTVPYLRYSRPDETGADLNALVIERLHSAWQRPYFMPRHLYVLPSVLRDSSPNTERYPEFGVYLSPKGASTQLHIDGQVNEAVLCQLYGKKRCFLISPEQAHLLPDFQGDRRATQNIARDRYPDFGAAHTVWETTLNPGEALSIPAGWPHEVYTLSASVSLTYNYTHISSAENWVGLVAQKLAALPEKVQLAQLLQSQLPFWKDIVLEAKKPSFAECFREWGFPDAVETCSRIYAKFVALEKLALEYATPTTIGSHGLT